MHSCLLSLGIVLWRRMQQPSSDRGWFRFFRGWCFPVTKCMGKAAHADGMDTCASPFALSPPAPSAPRALQQRRRPPLSHSRRHEEAWSGAFLHARHRGLLRLLRPEFGFAAGPGLPIGRGDRRRGELASRERLRGALQCECQSAGRVAGEQRRAGARAARHRRGIRLRGSVRGGGEAPQIYIFHGPYGGPFSIQSVVCSSGQHREDPQERCGEHIVWRLR